MGDAVSPERASQISENVNGYSRDILDEKGKLRLKVLATRNSSKLGIEGEEFAISLGANLDKSMPSLQATDQEVVRTSNYCSRSIGGRCRKRLGVGRAL